MLINNSLRVATIAAAICTGATLSSMAKNNDDFNYVVDRFADLQVLRYKVPDFENLSLRQKMLVYYLTEAALNGRDILWDQNGKHNLAIRGMLENVYTAYRGRASRGKASRKCRRTYGGDIQSRGDGKACKPGRGPGSYCDFGQ